MKLAVVVQRYGLQINGGAELHARYVAERLARHAQVEVLTTCARDYVTWRNELTPGVDEVNGVAVRRFPVARERDTFEFARHSERVFDHPHTIADELAWLDAEGPTCPALIDHLSQQAAGLDFVIAFTYRYYLAYHAVRVAATKTVLVPTAERDPAVGLRMFGSMFRGVRAVMYNSPEERAMIRAVAHNETVPSVVVGVGSEIPTSVDPDRFRRKFHVEGPFVIYVGRIDRNKGCGELFEAFETYLRSGAGRLTLVLVGQSILPVPQHPRIVHLGFLDDADKFDAIAAADLLVMPSYFESLSMVALEAWGLGRPVLANGACDVLKGQCIRSNAGLFYENIGEFVETLRTLERTPWLAGALGQNGRRFYRTHYDWPVVEGKYLDMLGSLAGRPPGAPEALPDSPRLDCRPAREVLAAVPAGWAREDQEPVDPRAANTAAPRPEPRASRGPRTDASGGSDFSAPGAHRA